MSIDQTNDLTKCLKPFPPEITDLVWWLRDFVWKLYPSSNEIIYDNYNAVAFGWTPSGKTGDVFCNIAIGRSSHNVQFGFYWGAKIADPKQMLIGNGNQYRYLLVTDKTTFPIIYIKKLIKEAYAYSVAKMKPQPVVPHGTTMLKSTSDKKRAPSKKVAAKMKGLKKK